ncbi:hypothetical protein EYC84_004380 [Monilinia fructicola]|uniref:Uncharacterized protein n=1 Tax=Monilinia fructicola TaxID=38448 RepID=A0A5M9K322_MONFR|nr:hypothetical protein EYC84_004380 [Monilinia fructicola]
MSHRLPHISTAVYIPLLRTLSHPPSTHLTSNGIKMTKEKRHHTNNAPSRNPKGIYKGVECKSAIQSHLKLSKSKLKFHIVFTSDNFFSLPAPQTGGKKDGDCMEERMKCEYRTIKSSNGGISKSQSNKKHKKSTSNPSSENQKLNALPNVNAIENLQQM